MIKSINRKKAAVIRLIASWVDQVAMFVTGLLLLPLYLEYLGVEGYGLWLTSGGIVAWLSMINVTTVVGQRVAVLSGKGKYVEASSYFWSSTLVSAGICVFVGGIGWGISYALGKIIKVPILLAGELRSAFQLAVFALLVQLLTSSASPFLNAIQKPIWILVFRPIVACAFVGVTYFALVFGCGLYAIPLGVLVRNLLIGVWGMVVSIFYVCSFSPRINPTRDSLMDILRHTPSALFGLLGQGACGRLQLTIIGMATSPQLVTAYEATTKAAQFIEATINRIILAVIPSFGHLYGQGDSARICEIIRKLVGGTFFVAIISCGGYILFNESFVKLWISNEIFIGKDLVLFVGISTLLLSLFNIVKGLSMSVGEIHWTCTSIGLLALVQVFSLPWAVSIWGIIAVPMVISLVIIPFLFFLAKLLRRNIESTLFSYKDLLLALLVAIVGIGLPYLVSQSLSIVSWSSFVLNSLCFGMVWVLTFIVVGLLKLILK